MVVLKRSREMVVVTTNGGFSAFAKALADKTADKGGFVGSERDKDGGVVTVGEKESVGSF